jgi:Tol biopolymer transport system component
MERRSAIVAVAVLAFAAASCRPSSEIRPAFTRETDAKPGGLAGRIIFTSQLERRNESGLFGLVPGEAEDRIEITQHPERSPAVSPDGAQLAFSVTGEESGLWTSGVDGSGPRRLTTEAGFYDHPTWSPDGARIAYAFSGGPGANWDIYTVGLQGGAPEQLTSDGSQDWYPSWSPDGATIAFTSDRDGDNALWALDVAAKQERKLVDGPEEDELGTWSPDGRSIVFSSNRDLERWQLFTYDVASRKASVLFRTDAMDRFPVFSPDGRYLAVSVGYLALYRADGAKLPDGADRWKLSDQLALSSTWVR